MKFFYCKKGQGLEPVLMIGADLDNKQIEELLNSSENCARGELITGSKGLIFQVDEIFQVEESEFDVLNSPILSSLERDIHGYFSRKVSALWSAQVVSRTHKNGRRENEPSL